MAFRPHHVCIRRTHPPKPVRCVAAILFRCVLHFASFFRTNLTMRGNIKVTADHSSDRFPPLFGAYRALLPSIPGEIFPLLHSYARLSQLSDTLSLLAVCCTALSLCFSYRLPEAPPSKPAFFYLLYATSCPVSFCRVKLNRVTCMHFSSNGYKS